jgi:hypothetical protein
MKVCIKISQLEYGSLVQHLRSNSEIEEAAFLFAVPERSEEILTFRVIEVERLQTRDFEVQEWNYLELKDETRARVIKRAHDLNAALIEIHSHVGSGLGGDTFAQIFSRRHQLFSVNFCFHTSGIIAMIGCPPRRK